MQRKKPLRTNGVPGAELDNGIDPLIERGKQSLGKMIVDREGTYNGDVRGIDGDHHPMQVEDL